ncbi:hypothetical protein UlMin_012574 [Ulmus minor]
MSILDTLGFISQKENMKLLNPFFILKPKLKTFLTQPLKFFNLTGVEFSTSFTLFILVYIDDIIVTGSYKEEIKQVILLLNKFFSLKDIGDLNYFLGIEVKTAREGLHLSQKRYIEDLLKRSKMENAKSLPTPMISNLKLTSLEGDPVPNAT